jgi:hypothetical protein
VTQADAIREALNALGRDAAATAVKDYIKEKHPTVSTTAAAFPSTVSTLRREIRGKGERPTPSAPTPAAGRKKGPTPKKQTAVSARSVVPPQSQTPALLGETQLVNTIQQLRDLVGRDMAKRVLTDIVDGL